MILTDHNRLLQSGRFSDIIVKVGPEKTQYNLHRAVICVKSAFFDLACKEEFLEGTTRIINLPEIDTEVFNIIATWMYDGGYTLPLPIKMNDAMIPSIYAAADFLQVTTLKEEIMKQIADTLSAEKSLCKRGKQISCPLLLIEGICKHAHRSDWSIMRNIIKQLVPWWFYNGSDFEVMEASTGNIFYAILIDVYQTLLRRSYCGKCMSSFAGLIGDEKTKCVNCFVELDVKWPKIGVPTDGDGDEQMG